MTWPNWSTARYTYRHCPGDLDVGLVDLPAVTDSVPTGPGSLGEQRGEPLNPPVDGDVVDLDPALGEELFDV
jgi:hypothetical protein